MKCLLQQRASSYRLCSEWSRDRQRERALELKPESGPSPAWLAAHHHPCSLLQAFMWSILQKPSSRGNVSLLANQLTSVPKQGASCPDTALPVGYVRTFLPSRLLSSPLFTLCVCVSLSPTLLAGCPSASLSASLFSPCPLTRCVCVCACMCVFMSRYAGWSTCKIIRCVVIQSKYLIYLH